MLATQLSNLLLLRQAAAEHPAPHLFNLSQWGEPGPDGTPVPNCLVGAYANRSDLQQTFALRTVTSRSLTPVINHDLDHALYGSNPIISHKMTTERVVHLVHLPTGELVPFGSRLLGEHFGLGLWGMRQLFTAFGLAAADPNLAYLGARFHPAELLARSLRYLDQFIKETQWETRQEEGKGLVRLSSFEVYELPLANPQPMHWVSELATA